MSVYIYGVEMPKEHPLYITLRPDGSVHVWDSYSGEGCGIQAIPVLEHRDLIDRDELLSKWHLKRARVGAGLAANEITCCMNDLRDMPTIIPADER